MRALKNQARNKNRPHQRQAIVLIALVLVLLIPVAVFLVLLRSDAGSARKRTPAKAYYDSLPGIELAGLSQTQREKLIDRCNRESCPCGCHLTIAQCRNVDSRCRTSVKIAELLIEKIKLESRTETVEEKE